MLLMPWPKQNLLLWHYRSYAAGGRSTVPDITVFRWDIIYTNADGTIGNSFTTHPDWTIEILSPDQLATRVTRNIFHCLNHGTELAWLIDPGEELILTYNLNSPPGLFEIGNDVLLPVPSFLPHLQLTRRPDEK